MNSTESTSTESDYDSDYDNDNMGTGDYTMGVISRYNRRSHGNCVDSEFNTRHDFDKVTGGYLYAFDVQRAEFFDKKHLHGLYDFICIHNAPKFTSLQIVKKERVIIKNSDDSDDDTYYTTAIVKTHYIRLIQRKWKRLYREMIMRKGNPINIRLRETCGKYPRECTRLLY